MPTGVLKKWDKQRKFGFIRPDQADTQGDIFIHISGFKNSRYPATLGEHLNYRVVPDKKSGKFRAVDAAPVNARDTAQSTAASTTTLAIRLRVTPVVIVVLALSLFCLVSASIFGVREQAFLPLLAYVLASLLAFGLYALDKHRAIKGAWRIPESALHGVELAGGWPGAFIAQQVIRHKTVKLSYQLVYWSIVAVHLGLWGHYWYSPAHSLLRLYLA